MGVSLRVLKRLQERHQLMQFLIVCLAFQGYQDKETAFDIFLAGFSFGAAILSHLLHC